MSGSYPAATRLDQADLMQEWHLIRCSTKSTSNQRLKANVGQMPAAEQSQIRESSFKPLQNKQPTNIATIWNGTKSSHATRSQKRSCPSTTSNIKILKSIYRTVFYKNTLTACLITLILTLHLAAVDCIVVYQLKAVARESGRTDYVVAGESVELSCQYTMKDEAEDVKHVIWSKDGKNFLRWRKNRPGLEVLSYTFKGHIHQDSSAQRLIINNVSTAMHGRYACSVRTDLGTHSGEHDLVVVSSQHCRLNDWRIHSEQTKCRETFRFDCRNMFPRPVPSCGLWDDKQSKFIRSVTIDISEESSSLHQAPNTTGNHHSNSSLSGNRTLASSARETYRIRYSDKYVMKFANGTTNPHYSDLLEYAGRLVFKCDILIPDTRWNVSLSHKMFDFQDGCNQDPLEAVESMRANYSQYAAQRLQQAAYSTLRRQQTEWDIEMLATSLKYEIIAPSHFMAGDKNLLAERVSPTLGSMHNADLANVLTRPQQSQAKKLLDPNLDLNCFQRPRIGSFARLSCANERKNHQVKLVGASLLECRPSGWVPVRSSLTNLGEPAVIRKQQVERKLSALAQAKRPTRAERSDGQILTPVSLNPSRVEGAGLNESGESGGANEDISNNEDDYDDDDSTKPEPTSNNATRALGSNNNNKPLKPVELEDRVLVENEIKPRLNTVSDQLTPAELASLLPACVSIAPAKTKNKALNKLPLIEASRGSGRVKELKQDEDEPWNWYIFSGSSASSANSCQPTLIIALLVACVALLREILTSRTELLMVS